MKEYRLKPVLLGHWVGRLVGMRDEHFIGGVGDRGIPMAGGLRATNDSEKQNGNCGGHSPRWIATVFLLGRRGNPIRRALCDGQTATHSRHPVHSTDLVEGSLSTEEGQAFAHLGQSMQELALRRIRAGLKNATIPNKAP
jgi:hypothetical protein